MKKKLNDSRCLQKAAVEAADEVEVLRKQIAAAAQEKERLQDEMAHLVVAKDGKIERHRAGLASAQGHEQSEEARFQACFRTQKHVLHKFLPRIDAVVLVGQYNHTANHSRSSD